MDGATAYDFLQKEATKDERGTFHVTQKKYFELMAANGITRDVIEAVEKAHGGMMNGMYQFNAAQLKDSIAEAKKDGRDPSKEKVRLSINVPNGSITMESAAAKSYPIPREPGKTVTKTMVTTLVINKTRSLDKDLCAATEAEMSKQLFGK